MILIKVVSTKRCHQIVRANKKTPAKMHKPRRTAISILAVRDVSGLSDVRLIRNGPNSIRSSGVMRTPKAKESRARRTSIKGGLFGRFVIFHNQQLQAISAFGLPES